LLIPPLFAALLLTFASPGRKRLKPFVLLTLAYLIPLTVFCAGYVEFTTLSMIHSTPPSVLGRMARELAIAVYFLVAVSLVIGTVLTVLRRLVCWLDDRIGQHSSPAPAESPSGRSRARVWIRQAVPLLLAVPIVLPYALATLYIHRVRVPNPPVPAEVDQPGFEDVSFVTADGLTLRGWFIPARQPSARTLLICHGLGPTGSTSSPASTSVMSLGPTCSCSTSVATATATATQSASASWRSSTCWLR
jgi:hypothetical protein